MKNNINSIIFRVLFCAVLALFIQSCKDNTPVEVINNNNQTQNSPALIDPQNQTSIQTTTPALQWNGYPSALSYRVQVSLDANFAGTMLLDTSGISGTQLTIPGGRLTPNVYNYWRVIAAVQGGESQWSTTWRFNIIFDPPTTPELLSPANNSTGQPFLPVFDWNDVSNVQYYRIQISGFPNFSPLLLDSNVIVTSGLQCPMFLLNTSTQYYWRVNASNSNGASTSPWSSIWNFTTIAGPEPNSISGRITFADSNFVQNPSFYSAEVYNTTNWPPLNGDYAFRDSLIIQRNGNTFFADYKLRHVLNGSYYLCVQSSYFFSFAPATLGIYGCDTVHVQYSGCPNSPNPVTISNNNGIENINFIAWADTSKKIF